MVHIQLRQRINNVNQKMEVIVSLFLVVILMIMHASVMRKNKLYRSNQIFFVAKS